MQPNRSFWGIVLTISLVFGFIALKEAIPQLQSLNIALWRSKWTLLLLLFLANILFSVPLIWMIARGRLDNLLNRLNHTALSGTWLVPAIIGIFLSLGGFWFIRLKIFADILPQQFPSIWLFLWSSLIAGVLLKWITSYSLLTSFAAVVLLQGVLFRVWGILHVVTDFPFTLEYSETSRFYYASLVFAQSIYGMDLPLSTLHPSRYLIQSIPFLIPDLPLWAHRLWQALLWISLTGTSSFLLARRFRFPQKHITVLVALWAFVYFLQGTVYYHLHICVIIILLGVSPKNFWRSLFAVVLASLWAGISRVNWFPVPAMLAIALYLLEKPVSDSPKLSSYLGIPALWATVGIASALLSQFLYIYLSGNSGNAGDFGTSFTSDLIWSRLLPNHTYPLGILPGIFIVSFPLWMALIYFLAGHQKNWHFIRPLGIFSMLAVLFVGGAIVSTKIGGGADLHNMDAYLALLAIIVLAFYTNQVPPDLSHSNWGNPPTWPLVFAILIPVFFSVSGVRPPYSYDKELAQKELQELRQIVEETAAQNGEILFISERQMIMFDMVDGVEFIPEYEVTTLMEMAMSGNQAYLDRFTNDLANHRFALIVTRTQRIVKKDDEPFAEENNAWIDSISRPLLCYYERSLTLKSSNTLILIPTQTRESCP